MSPFLQLSLALVFIISAAKAGGYLSYRLGQPSVLGELLVGIILGPSVLNILHLPFFTDEHLGEVIHQLAEIGVMLLMFLAGLELHLKDLGRSGKVAILSGTLGVILPLMLGIGVGLSFQMDFLSALFIGLILSATSVSISAQTLMEMNVLRSRVGIGLLGAAVFDDVLVVLGLSLFTAVVLSDATGPASILIVFVKMFAFLVSASVIGWLLLPKLSRKVTDFPVSQGLTAFTMVVVLLYGWGAEVIGSMAAITGAFLAGLMLSRSPVRERIEHGVSILAYGVFVPVFFINVGLSANAREMGGENIWLFLAMSLVAILGKVVGAGAGAGLSGFERQDALRLGVGMVSRGEVGLIVAAVGINEGIIGQEVFSALVGVVIITTLLTPLLLKALYSKPAHRGDSESGKRLPETKRDEI
jgi:Kef-type K+ transport system membrane component KefB